MSKRVGAAIGRFQIDELHTGHLALLDYISTHYNRMLILVGVRPADYSDTNPLSFEVREAMLKEAYPHATVLPLQDHRSDAVWSKRVDGLVQSTYGYDVDCTFHAGRDSFAPHYSGKYDVEIHDFGIVDLHKPSGTEKRNEIQQARLNSAEARLGAIHAIMNLPHRHVIMVDMFVWKDNKDGTKSVLVGRKEGEKRYRLPGGMVEKDETFKRAASRELHEETGVILTDGSAGWQVVDDFNVPDWRVRDTDQITYKTVLMVAPFSWGRIKPGDDLEEVTWLRFGEVAKHNIVEEHYHLFAAGMEFVTGNVPVFTLQSNK